MKLIGAAVVALLIVGCRAEEAPADEPVRTVRAMKVADVGGLTGRSFPGRAAATQEVDLAFRVPGPLIGLPVLVGDAVEQGGLIARIDPRDFKVHLRNAEAQLMDARAAYDLAVEEHVRGQAAFEKGGLNPIELARLREQENTTKAGVDSMEAAVDSARDALNDTDLLAPFSGTIVAVHVENFENVRRDQAIVRLLDKSRIEFGVDIPETLISLIYYVEDVRVQFDAFPGLEVPAEVLEIGTEASVTTRTFPVTLVMDQPEGTQILPGMAGRAFGTVRLDGDEQLDIVIPVTAVFSPTTDGKSYVWVIDPTSNAVGRRAVQIGNLVSGGYVVQSGLETGELIATAGVHFLKEGQEVEPRLQ